MYLVSAELCVQLVAAWVVSRTATPWWLLTLAAYFIGGFMNHSLGRYPPSITHCLLPHFLPLHWAQGIHYSSLKGCLSGAYEYISMST